MSAVTSNPLLDRLNPEQAQAVSLKWGPALIIAGAGSGKTTVLTRRIAWLISELNQDPESVLAVTFTNKAAGEMKHRIEDLVGQDVGRRLVIGTFHSVCARILRREIGAYESNEGWKWNSNFVIYDETDSVNVVKAVVQKLNLDDKVFIPKNIRHEISALKNDGLTCSAYSSAAKTYREQRISEIFNQYQADLARNNAFDFDDLIGVFTDLLKKNPSVLARQRRRFRHVMVDEFQDTNKAQYDLISMLSPTVLDADSGDADWEERSLMVVGDVDQSIYSWRKADFRIILGFQKEYKGCQLIKLEENYRSTSTILEIANSIIVNNTERLDKVLRCNRGKGAKAQFFEAQDEIDEAFYVVEELKRLKTRGRNHSESVILYRTNAQSRAIEEILVRNHIPYIVVGGTRFYDRQEIKDVLAYLKLIYNGRDSISFNRVINTPRRGIGKTSLERLQAYADENNITLVQAAGQSQNIHDIPQKAAGALKEFALLLNSWQSAAKTLAPEEQSMASDGTRLESGKAISVSELLQRVLRETRYLEKLAEESDKDELAEGRIENVKELVAVAEEFDNVADEPDLDSFLTRISLVSDLDAVKLNEDAVKMMTIHSAKGLEFPVVFVMGLEEGLFPHMRSLDSPTAMEEERRLMYVAVTRAGDCLYLTRARKRMVLGRGPTGNFSTNYTIPSQFLCEIAPGLLAGYYPSPGKEAQGAGSDADPESVEGDFDEDNHARGRSGGVNRGGDYATSGAYAASSSGGYSNSKYGGSGYGGSGGGYGGGSSNNNRPGYGGGGSSADSPSYGGPGYGGSGSNNRPGYFDGGSSGAGPSYGDTGSGGSAYGTSNNSPRAATPSGGGSGGTRPSKPRVYRTGETPPPAPPASSTGAPKSSNAPRATRATKVIDHSTNAAHSSNESRKKELESQPPSPADNTFEHFVVGDTVQHVRFGTGKVVQVIGEQDKEIYNIEFEEAGKRLLDPRFAKLMKID